jgi:hypothetical protein
MSTLAPTAMQAKLLRILHRAFVQARNLALNGDSQQLYDLADTFEILPEMMARWDETTLSRIRSILAEYESAHPNSGYEYLSLLTADDTESRTDCCSMAIGIAEEPAERGHGRGGGHAGIFSPKKTLDGPDPFAG